MYSKSLTSNERTAHPSHAEISSCHSTIKFKLPFNIVNWCDGAAAEFKWNECVQYSYLFYNRHSAAINELVNSSRYGMHTIIFYLPVIFFCIWRFQCAYIYLKSTLWFYVLGNIFDAILLCLLLSYVELYCK